jgi:hypothetical protein
MWLESNSRHILQKFRSFGIEDLTSYKVLPITKSSPHGSKSYRHIITSFMGIEANEALLTHIATYLYVTKSENIKALFRNIKHIVTKFSIPFQVDYSQLGKLSFKEEAAGKLRVFAMVDVITQSILEPLHSCLFDLFKKLPNDCTHDQDRGVKYAQDLSIKYGCSFGFDLSAATDRLPISSQVSVLNSVFGNHIGTLWGRILTDRDYYIHENEYGIPTGPIRYEVGQPMGALSSWAMLNLVHHMMIQFIAVHLGKVSRGEWYLDYIVLGDDLALFDKEVADRYLSLCKQLGVGINLSKSIVAERRPVLEFAKRTSINGVDVSALPFKEIISSNNFFGRLAITTRLIRNKWGKDMFKLLTIGNRRRVNRPIDSIYPMIGFLTQLYQNRVIPIESVLALITQRDKPLSFFGRNINWMKPGPISRVVRGYFSTGTVNKNLLPQKDRFFAVTNSVIFKNILLHRINNIVKKIDGLNLIYNRMEIVKTLSGLEDLSEKDYMYISPFADIFFVEKGKSIPSLRLLNQGLDIDLSLGKGYTFKVMTYKLQYLNEFNNNTNYYNSQGFIDLKLDTLLRHLDVLNNLVKTLEFYRDQKDSNKDVIDNPLKILDFIKDIHNPKYKVESDFVKFDDQYYDSSITFDNAPGFKPQFDFDRKNKKPSISFDFGEKNIFKW